ncbi:GPI-anchored cell wall beta-1,3-endoglucanase EglC [Pseudovirgaria hyperparasitica]|uniref:glucan endo-1,3-beta-D-glucosidase n=1 Tax=Pseudovirgaria hyperparasitica TaxID=470096 RepID=A0A6A6VU98_9PEZI|nr:GPI-anchored cell wall beta-1,3-endoglucanase EglC [Pseudovirgaria hyperparasitica]KAF2752821.1 GPI-anchored cell wall beta-1,3-endoglucanase EglC [Pseudovirgaria hyperparasitica]
MLLKIFSFLSLACSTSAQFVKGFNTGNTNAQGACRYQNDFTTLFNQAKNLPDAGGFASARLYTMIQCGTLNEPIQAIQSAIDTDTKLLLGLWASAGREAFNEEMNVLMRAISQYGDAFTSRVVGVSIGSEDLYRSSSQGVKNNAGVGEKAEVIAGYIGWARDWLRGTALERTPLGHVDTWTAWVLPENKQVIEAVDVLGHNSFPYWESTLDNNISNAANIFWSALDRTEGVAQGKPVWVTETGYPHRGPNSGYAVANAQNARQYYAAVGCELFKQRNTFWYTLENANTAQTDLSFAVNENGNVQYDLSC